jgi:hypothetical protein
MITEEQRKQLNEWFRCSAKDGPKVEALSAAALHFAKAIMENVPAGMAQVEALASVQYAWGIATHPDDFLSQETG